MTVRSAQDNSKRTSQRPWAAAGRRATIILFAVLATPAVNPGLGQDVLIPMDAAQSNHLKAYGAAYWILQQGIDVDWLLNYRGGSFLLAASAATENELRIRGVSYERSSAAQSARLISEIEDPDLNASVVRLEKPPRIAVYAPDQTLPWDDAVLLALTYAEVPYEMIYDDEVLDGKLSEYDWLHLHHEDFTGQYGKFFTYRSMPWYIEQQRDAENTARQRGFRKVSQLKLAVAETIRDYVSQGGFLFAMCSGTDTFDIALAARNTDIVPSEYDGDPVDTDALQRLDFSRSFAFQDFRPSFNPNEYEHSDIDTGPPPTQLQNPAVDFFTLFDFSAKWDPVPSMLTQNHVATVKGFVGQTTAFRKLTVKPNVVVLAESPGRDQVKYLHGTLGEGTFTFYAGHDPEDYQHFVGDPPTDLNLHKNSPGYRLILNNVLFPRGQEEETEDVTYSGVVNFST